MANFGYISSYPEADNSDDCPIQTQELTKKRLREVAHFRMLFLTQVVRVSSLSIINFLNGQFRKLLQFHTLKELLNCLNLALETVG